MAFPEIVVPLIDDHLVKFVLVDCQLEWQFLEKHCEEHDPQSEDVAFFRRVLPVVGVQAVVYLRRHVSLHSSFAFVEGNRLSILPCPAGQAEITDLNTDLFLLTVD
jgi:hypothetical protein